MNQKYLLDISEHSISINNTPSLPFQKLPFYVHGWGHFYANPSYYTERDGLENYLLIYTLSGKGQLTYEHGTYTLVPGELVIFNCMAPHLYHTKSEEPWEFMYIHFNGSAVELYENLLNQKGLNVVALDEIESFTKSLLEIYHLILSGDLDKELKICARLTSILTELITLKKSSPTATKHHQYKEQVEGVIQFLRENFNTKISTDALAERMMLSKFHFLRVFKSYTGLSPYEYLINYRINQSKALLKDTDHSIGEICELIGFNDVNNYIRYFKRLVGTTPGGYRKNWI
ncbi:MAG: AraC family transcriptional regulator [Vallitaleaceae bacterium]|nr:AraC family transcriptional regulator [Vallitaleaceae bacterium]